MNYIYQYYQGIKNGTYLVGRHIRAIYDYLVAGIEQKTFFFDERKAQAAVDWIEAHCYHVEGPLAPGPFRLEVWQKALLSAVFGIAIIALPAGIITAGYMDALHEERREKEK